MPRHTPEEWAAIEARVARSRAAKGLPPKVDDPVVLDECAAMFIAALGPTRVRALTGEK